ncbi:unnamed protein product [Prorocentrum cordatum]|uniref:Uncharacterized protein n=1 Tax=Prorocentrum cordatum TaxID=2364126 RepID=A0ABN9YIQ5_9DINO|nr:unnamed protein product [Polarella glacialis]
MPRARACFLAALLLGAPTGAVQLQSAAAAEASTATGVSTDTPFVETLEDTPPELPGQEENATQAASDPGRMCTASSLACGPARPRSAGCFVWLPSGCKTPHHFHAKFHWRRDTWGEANAQAGQSEKACKARKQAFDAWCGVTDTVMLLTSPREVLVEDEGGQEEAPEAPEAVPQAVAEADAAAEEARAADVVDSLPEAAPALPRSTGCFVWLPSGCKTPHHFHAKFQWRRDTWGEANAQAGQSEKACKARKQAFDAWCGVTDTVMLLTSPREVLVEDEGGQGEAPEAPEAVPQAVAEADAAAEEARAADVVDSLPEAAPALPRSTGCFVWLPSGCKTPHHFHAKFQWRRDTWGEANAQAGQSEKACKARKQPFDAWCGVTDTVMLLTSPREVLVEGEGERGRRQRRQRLCRRQLPRLTRRPRRRGPRTWSTRCPWRRRPSPGARAASCGCPAAARPRATSTRCLTGGGTRGARRTRRRRRARRRARPASTRSTRSVV